MCTRARPPSRARSSAAAASPSRQGGGEGANGCCRSFCLGYRSPGCSQGLWTFDDVQQELSLASSPTPPGCNVSVELGTITCIMSLPPVQLLSIFGIYTGFERRAEHVLAATAVTDCLLYRCGALWVCCALPGWPGGWTQKLAVAWAPCLPAHSCWCLTSLLPARCL